MKNKVKTVRMATLLSIFSLVTFTFSVPVFAAESQLVKKVDTLNKIVALTFDDGTNGDNLQKILQVLSENNVPATFFMTGEGVSMYPELTNNILTNGNQLGNHSYSHPTFLNLTYDQRISEIERTDALIQTVTGELPSLFRAPWGETDSSILQAIDDAGYGLTIGWSVDTKDKTGISADAITKTVVSNVQPGSIVLMHASSGAVNTPDAVSSVISNLSGQGYKFVTVSDLLTYGDEVEADYDYDASFNSGYGAGFDSGYSDGYNDNYGDGYGAGFNDVGYTYGYESGYSDGYGSGYYDAGFENITETAAAENVIEEASTTKVDDYDYDASFDSGYGAGFDSGYSDGYNDNYGNGYGANFNDEGYTDGYESGYSDGYGSGYYDAGFENITETAAAEDVIEEAGTTKVDDYDYDASFDSGYDAGFDSGYSDGYNDNYGNGYGANFNDEGYTDGYESGYSDGYGSGYYDAGYAEN